LGLVANVELVAERGPFESIATANRCGRRPVTIFCSMFTVPITACVGSPLELELSGAIAWYARKT
jgi:hypothetical protein